MLMTAMSAVITWLTLGHATPNTHPRFQLIGCCYVTVLFMDWFENMELSAYGVLSLPNFPCFCVSCEFDPSLQHPPAGWFTINCFTQLFRIKAVWLVLSFQQSPNVHPRLPNYSDVKNPGVLKKTPYSFSLCTF